MSTINTNGINANYPVPGENNSSQGFRDNFTSTKNNLDIAGTEITDLQQKAVVKSGLVGIPIDNNMANTLISNAAVRSFRATTFNLGNSLSGTVTVNASLGDVQIGTLTANTTLTFGGWAPTNTESSIKLKLTSSNANASLSFPANVVLNGSILENATVDASGITTVLQAPYGSTLLEYKLTTVDCGNTIVVDPINRPYRDTQVQLRNPPATGQPGDRPGTIAVGITPQPVSIVSTTSPSTFTASGNTGFFNGLDITFVGPVNPAGANVDNANVFYVANATGNTFSVATSSDGNVSNVVTVATQTGVVPYMQARPQIPLQVCGGEFDSEIVEGNVANTYANGTVTLSSSLGSEVVNSPIVFTGANAEIACIDIDRPYYIKSISGANIVVSDTQQGGVAGGASTLDDTTFSPPDNNFGYTVYKPYATGAGGHYIWIRYSHEK